MNKTLSIWTALLLLSGCTAVKKYIHDSKTPPALYTIEQLGLTMGVPVGFNVVISPKANSQDLSKGLIWQIEKERLEPYHLKNIKLFYDRNDEAEFSMDRYIEDSVIPDIVGNGLNMKMTRKKLRISGIPARVIEVVNQYKGPEGEYQLYIQEAILKKDRHIFRWRLTGDEFDSDQLDPIFHKFLKTIRF